mgnify:CR=1 FL=1
MNLTCLKSGIWQAELRVPREVRRVIGKTRFAKFTGTRNKRKAVLRAAPMLAQWQSDIELAKSDPQTLIAKQAHRKAQQAFRPLSQEFGVAEDHLAWLRNLPPSKASKYEAIEWGSGTPLPAHMESFIQSHYIKSDTRSEAWRYVLEATIFTPTLESLTKFNAQRWLTEEEGKEPSTRRALKTMQKATGYLPEYVAWLQYRSLVCQNLANPCRQLHYPKTLTRPKKYEALTYGNLFAKDSDGTKGRRFNGSVNRYCSLYGH